MGLFYPFLDDISVKITGIEAGGMGLQGENHCASLTANRPGVLHGNRTYLLQDDEGQIIEGHSISAGLDYPGIGPEHAWLKESVEELNILQLQIVKLSKPLKYAQKQRV